MFEACTAGASVSVGRCGCSSAACSDGCRCNQCGPTGDAVVVAMSREDGDVLPPQQDAALVLGAAPKPGEEDPGFGPYSIYAPAVVLSREEREEDTNELNTSTGSAAQKLERWLTKALELEDEWEERRKAMARPEGGRGPMPFGGTGGNYAAHVLETRPSRQQWTTNYAGGPPPCPSRSFKVRACDALAELEDSVHRSLAKSHKELMVSSADAMDSAMDFAIGRPDEPARKSP